MKDIKPLLEARKVLTDKIATSNVQYCEYEKRKESLQSQIDSIDVLIRDILKADTPHNRTED